MSSFLSPQQFRNECLFLTKTASSIGIAAQVSPLTAVDVLNGGIQRADVNSFEVVRLNLALAELHVADPLAGLTSWRASADACDAAMQTDFKLVPESARKPWAMAAYLRATAAFAQVREFTDFRFTSFMNHDICPTPLLHYKFASITNFKRYK